MDPKKMVKSVRIILIVFPFILFMVSGTYFLDTILKTRESAFEINDTQLTNGDSATSHNQTQVAVYDRRGVVLPVNTSMSDLDELGLQSIVYALLKKKDSTESMTLSIDSELQSKVYAALEEIAMHYGYVGGAGVIMDIETGEVLSLVSYPGVPKATEPFLNRATNGLFVPGSVMKPFVAVGALAENIISPTKKILSTGSIELHNPFREGEAAVFHDWKAHGYVDMREAIGVSSNVYFYTIGGGFEGQQGLGIEKLEEYLRMFGFGSITGIDVLTEGIGQIPNPEWKAREFNGASWQLGDTYLASIGQHGYQVTPLQLTRAIAALASNGELSTPTLLHSKESVLEKTVVPIKKEYFQIVQEGMEYAVMHGTASGLYMEGLSVAAKTGTAEVGSEKEFIHSWITGYFPNETPRYAFTFMLESGPWGEEIGAVAVAKDVLKWLSDHRQEYAH